MKTSAFILLIAFLLCACKDGEAQEQSNQKRIRGAVMEKIEPFTICYNEAQVEEPGIRGRIAFSFNVATDGSVSHVEFTENQLGKKVRDCFARVIDSLTIPPVTQPTRYRESFCFESDPQGDACRRK